MNYLLNPVFVVAYGGVAVRAAMILRALQVMYTGNVLKTWKWLLGDYETDDTAANCPAFFDSKNWQAALPTAGETAPISISDDCQGLEARIEAGDGDVVWLRRIAPRGLIASYRGSEGAQVPRFTRIGLALGASDTLNSHRVWTKKIESGIRSLALDGSLMSSVLIDSPELVASRPTVVVLFGNGGGTGSGASIALGVAVRFFQSGLGIKLNSHAYVLGGAYRQQMSVSGVNGKIAHALDLDLNHAMSSRAGTLSLPVGPDESIEAPAPLFDRVNRLEATGRLAEKTDDFARAVAESVLFTYASPAAAALQLARANDEQLPGVLHLLKK